MSELRKYQRKQIKDYLIINDCNSGEIIGQVVNLTADGIMTICENHINEKAVHECKMRLPDVIEGHRDIDFIIQCCWCRENKRIEMFECGFKFINQSPLLKNILRTLIRDWAIETPTSAK